MSCPPFTAAQKPRMASINGLPIRADRRLFHGPQGRRPGEDPGPREIG